MQGKAEDAGGLPPTKDDNVALRKSSPRQLQFPDLVEYYVRRAPDRRLTCRGPVSVSG